MNALDDPEMTFIYRNGQVVGVRCSCGWEARGNGGASAHGMAWGDHANTDHAAILNEDTR